MAPHHPPTIPHQSHPPLMPSDHIPLSTGRLIPANRGIIGLAPPDDDGWSITEGFDCGVWHQGIWDYNPAQSLTRAELLELADIMLARWTAFRTYAETLPADGPQGGPGRSGGPDLARKD